jgi:nitrogen fixation/metabolism regulation signal transduction histidine kinase
VLVASSSTYLLLADSLAPEVLSEMTQILVVQTSLLLLAVFGLGVFTTHRLAGPWIAVRRALDDVADGNFDRTLTVRQADAYLKEVEGSFNDMMETIRENCADRSQATDQG